MDSHCDLCNDEFEGDTRGYKRKSFVAKLPRNERSTTEVLDSELGITVTPQKKRFLCHKCAQKINTLDVSAKRFREARQSLRSSGYLKRKLDSRVSTPGTPAKPSTPVTTPKRTRVVSTPLKGRLFVTPQKVCYDLFLLFHSTM